MTSARAGLGSLALDHGQTQAEYALLMAGVFLVVAVTVLLVGPPISDLFQSVVDALG